MMTEEIGKMGLDRLFREWVQEEPPAGLSAAQIVRHLALQLWRSGSSLGEYLKWSLQSPEEQSGSVKELFPLPLWYDGRESLRDIIDDSTVKDKPGDWRKRGETKPRASKVMRGDGLRAWHGLAVVALNHLYGHRGKDGETPRLGSTASPAQEAALNVLWDLGKNFVSFPGFGTPNTPFNMLSPSRDGTESTGRTSPLSYRARTTSGHSSSSQCTLGFGASPCGSFNTKFSGSFRTS